MAKKRKKRHYSKNRKNPFDDAGAEATGIYTLDNLSGSLEANPSQFLNWEILAQIASEGLPGSKLMMKKALLKEFNQNPMLKARIISVLKELVEGAEQQMIGAARRNPGKRLPKRRGISQELDRWVRSDQGNRQRMIYEANQSIYNRYYR